MMNGVKFVDKDGQEKHSITDWDLLMISKNIPDAEPKEIYLDIPYADGQLDITEWTGSVNYNNRQLTFTFDIFQNSDEWWELRKEISTYLNGRRMKITLDQDQDFYYYGRCKIPNFSNITTVANIVVEANVEPYKYLQEETVIEIDMNGNYNGFLSNLFRPVVPEITTDAPIGITMNGISRQISAGTFKFVDFALGEGQNQIDMSGTANVTIRYQQAVL